MMNWNRIHLLDGEKSESYSVSVFYFQEEFELTIDISVSKLKKEDVERALQNIYGGLQNAY